MNSKTNKIIDKIKKFGIFETIVLLIYIILILVIASMHEYNEDEAQSWLIARDLNPIQIINQTKYEGHSFLWYYIIFPFAKLGFSVEIQKFISCIFAILTVIIILKKSPFNKILKFLLIFSSGMIYFYSVLARPYCMIPFLLVCISVLYKNKKEHPYIYATLVGLLAHTHLVMVPTSILLVITFWGEELFLKHKIQTKESKKTLIKSLLLVLTIISIYGIIVIFTLNNCEILTNNNKTNKIISVGRLFYFFKNTCTQMLRYLYGASKVPNYYKLLSALVITLCVIGTKNNLKQGIIFWSQLIFTILIHTFCWFTTATRVLIIIYTLMFWLWNYKEDDQYKKKSKENLCIELALILLIVISAPGAYMIAYQDVCGNYSTGKITAKYIQANIPKGAGFIGLNNELQQSIIVYMKKNEYDFYMSSSDKIVTFNTWDEQWNKSVTKLEFIELIDKLKKQYTDLYVFSIVPVKLDLEYDIELQYSSEDKQIDNIYANSEKYYIYKINLNENIK